MNTPTILNSRRDFEAVTIPYAHEQQIHSQNTKINKKTKIKFNVTKYRHMTYNLSSFTYSLSTPHNSID